MKSTTKQQHAHDVQAEDVAEGNVYETGMGRIEVTVRPRTREHHRWYEATLTFTGGFVPPGPLLFIKPRKLGQEKDHESS